MPGNTMTALQEIQGRVETLDKQIEQAHAQASYHAGEATVASEQAAQMKVLRAQYAEILGIA